MRLIKMFIDALVKYIDNNIIERCYTSFENV